MNFLSTLKQKDFYKHEASAVNYPLNMPDDMTTGINREDSYLDQTILNTSLYRECMDPSSIKPMQYNKGIERAISRLVAPNCCKGITGYSAYGFDVNGNFFADYWDGTAEDFNKDIADGVTDFSRCRHQLFKIDDKGKLFACVVDEGGNRSKLVLDTKANNYSSVPKHSPSGLMFALTAYIVGRMEYHRFDSTDPGYEVAKVVYDHFTNLVDGINSANQEKTANYLRCLDNDMYMMYRFEEKVKDKYDTLPFIKGQVDRNEYPILSETEFDMAVINGHSAYLSGTVYMSQEGGFVNEDDMPNKKKIEEIIAEESTWKTKYLLDPDRELTPEEELMVPHKDGMVPPRQILTKAEMIKASTELPRPYRNILLTGETGSGKSTASALMAQLFHLPYTFLTINPDTILSDLYVNILPATKGDKKDLEELTTSLPNATDITLDPVASYYQITGKVKPDATEEDCANAIQDSYYNLLNKSNGFIKVESPLVQAFRYGWVCEIQEVNVANKPGVLSGINAALDDLATIQLPDGEVVKRHPDCVIIMTANVDYEGTRKINQAVKSRCALKGRLNLPEDASLIEMVKLDSGYEDTDVIKKMIQAMRGIRKVLNETGTTDGSCGVREIVAWAQGTKILKDPYRAAMHTIVPSATEDDEVLAEVIGALENYFVKKNSSSEPDLVF